MSDFHEWHVKLFLLTCTLKKVYTFIWFRHLILNYSMFFDLDRDFCGKSTQVHNYWLQKVDNSHDLENWHIWLSSKYNYLCHQRFKYYFGFGSYKNSQTLNARSYLKNSIMALKYFSYYIFKWEENSDCDAKLILCYRHILWKSQKCNLPQTFFSENA